MKDRNILIDSFVEANKDNVDSVIQILKDRLPRSSNTYNMGLMSRIVPSEVKLFVYLNDLSPNAWILCTAMREDYGNDICISAPINPVITREIKEAFSKTKSLDWDKSYMFSSVDTPIANMIREISSVVKNNETLFLPQYSLYMERADALKLDVTLPNGLTKKSLKSESGVNFLTKTWPFVIHGTMEYIERVTKLCPSCGIYDSTTDQPVSGILLNFNGLVGMLFSTEKYRGKGLAQLCTKSLLKQMAVLGFIPSSSLGVSNIASKAFHEKIGMKITHETVDLIHIMSNR